MKHSLPPNKYTPLENGLPTVGWGPFKYQWYSICSGHRIFEEVCPRCIAGTWVNCWAHEVGHFVYEHNPVLWRWWANRPALIPALAELYKAYQATKNKSAK